MAFRRNGWNNAEIKTLSEGNILADVLRVIKGQAEIKVIEHLIDTDAQPFIPGGMSVESHIGHGLWKWAPELIQLFLSKEQKRNYQEGNKLWKVIEALKGKIILNANVLDYLLAHPELIPESWKGKLVFFWGTIYRFANGELCVRCLKWDGSRWGWYYCWLDDSFHFCYPAALAS